MPTEYKLQIFQKKLLQRKLQEEGRKKKLGLIRVYLGWWRYRHGVIYILQIFFVIVDLLVTATWLVLHVIKRANFAFCLDVKFLTHNLDEKWKRKKVRKFLQQFLRRSQGIKNLNFIPRDKTLRNFRQKNLNLGSEKNNSLQATQKKASRKKTQKCYQEFFFCMCNKSFELSVVL